MTWTAILTVCLISVPTDCRTHEIYLTEWMPTMQMMEAQQKAVEWLSKHPGYVKADLRVLPGRGA